MYFLWKFYDNVLVIHKNLRIRTQGQSFKGRVALK